MRAHSSLLGFCHNDLQYGNMLLHTAAPRSLSFDLSARGASPERAVRGGSPPPRRGASSPDGGPRFPAGTSPDLEGCASIPLTQAPLLKTCIAMCAQ
jgi:hypothetical protein